MDAAPPIAGPENSTALYKYAQQACEYVQHTIFRKTDPVNGYDCNDVARKVDDAWKGTKDAAGFVYDTVTWLPGALVDGYNGIGEIPLVGRGVQIVLVLGTAWLAYSFAKGPETHFFVPKKQIETVDQEVSTDSPLSVALKKNRTLRIDLLQESKKTVGPQELQVYLEELDIYLSAARYASLLAKHGLDPLDLEKKPESYPHTLLHAGG